MKRIFVIRKKQKILVHFIKKKDLKNLILRDDLEDKKSEQPILKAYVNGW